MLYVKPWLECTVATKAPNQDLCFFEMLKEYEKVDAIISKASISKFSHHLWYFREETVILSLFDDEVDSQTKKKIIANLCPTGREPQVLANAMTHQRKNRLKSCLVG